MSLQLSPFLKAQDNSLICIKRYIKCQFIKEDNEFLSQFINDIVNKNRLISGHWAEKQFDKTSGGMLHK
jgi:hypothetical protein